MLTLRKKMCLRYSVISGSPVEFRGFRRLRVVSLDSEIQTVSYEYAFVYTDVGMTLVQWTGKVAYERSPKIIRVRYSR